MRRDGLPPCLPIALPRSASCSRSPRCSPRPQVQRIHLRLRRHPAFHVPPAIDWLPPLSSAAIVLPPAPVGGRRRSPPRCVATCCAWCLAGGRRVGALLDPEHYSHGAQFHLTLLALAGCSRDGLLAAAAAAGGRCRRAVPGMAGAARAPSGRHRLLLRGARQGVQPILGALGDRAARASVGRPQPRSRAAPAGQPGAHTRHTRRLSVGTILTEFLLAIVALVPRSVVGLVIGLLFRRVDRVPPAAGTLRLGPAGDGARVPARGRPRMDGGVLVGVRGMSPEPCDPVAARLAQAPSMGDPSRSDAGRCRY